MSYQMDFTERVTLRLMAYVAVFAAGFWCDRWLHRPIEIQIPAAPHASVEFYQQETRS